MFAWLKRKKHKKKTIPGEDTWVSHFGHFNEKRFEVVNEAFFSSTTSHNGLKLSLKKKNFFAWVDAGDIRYRNFFIDAMVEFPEQQKEGSTGFLLRHLNDENYYYFLISTSGFFRFDAVFNGTPIPLIVWTPCGYLKEGANRITILVRESRFLFFINEHWVADASSDLVYSGKIAFAAQNYNLNDLSDFYLTSIKVESHESSVESDYALWESMFPPEREPLMQLALMYGETGRYKEAEVYLNKAFMLKEASSDEKLFLCRAYSALGRYDDALKGLEEILFKEKDNKSALMEKAYILASSKRFTDLAEVIENGLDLLADNSAFLNLAGQSAYVSGDYALAGNLYSRAFSLSPLTTSMAEDAAHAYFMAKDFSQAVTYYLHASKNYFRQKEFEQLKWILEKVEELDPGRIDVVALKAKVLFYQNNKENAEEILLNLIDRDIDDSSIYYLYGILLSEKGQKQEALDFFKKAGSMEPDIALYHFRVAETLYLLGKDVSIPLKKASKLDPDDPWINNLQGLIASGEGDFIKADLYFKKACSSGQLTKEEKIPLIINYSCNFQSLGDFELSREILDDYLDYAAIQNHKGNLYVVENNTQEAIRCYEEAIRLDRNIIYLENTIDLCIQLERYTRAEELLGELIETTPSAYAYNKMGVLALNKGDSIRADVSFQTALAVDPDLTEAKLNLVNLYYGRYNTSKALEIFDSINSLKLTEDLKSSYLSVRRLLKEKIECASCGREWWVPRNLPPQKGLRINGEPPDEAPAGRSPETGKVYCIGCAKEHLQDGRFICPESGTILRLGDDSLKYLIAGYVESLLDK